MRKLLSPLLLAGAIAVTTAGPVGAELEYCMVDPAVTVDHTTVEVGLYTTDQVLLHHVSGPIQITLRGAHGATVSSNAADWNRGQFPVQLSVADNLPGHGSAKKQPLVVEAMVPAAGTERYFIKISMPDGHVYEGFGDTNRVNQLRVDVPQK